MSWKKSLGGLVVVGLIGTLTAGEALAGPGGRAGFRGGPAGGVSSAATRRPPTRTIPTPGSNVTSPATRRGNSTLPPQVGNFTPPGRRNTFAQPNRNGKAAPGFNGPRFPGQAQPGKHPKNVWDHLGVGGPANGPSPPPRPGGQNLSTWTNSPYQPFTPAWYAQHPTAWQVTHPHADAAAVATTAAVATWLGVAYGPTTTSTVVIEGTIYAEQPSTTEQYTEQSTDGELDPSGATPIADDAEWMPLGIFDLKPDTQAEATRVIQLAVNRDGEIRGTYYDQIGDGVGNIRGTVDKQKLQAVWTVGETGRVVFEIPLAELSKPDGKVTVRFPEGRTAAWYTNPVSQ